MPALLALLERAVLVFTEANREGEQAVSYRVRPIVKETNEGYRFYDHDLGAAQVDAPG